MVQTIAHLQEFPDLESFLRVAETSERMEGSSADDRGDFFVDWTDSASLAESISMARGSWSGAEEIQKIAAQLIARLRVNRPETRMREVGPGSLSMGRYVSGHPQPYAVRVSGKSTAPNKSHRGRIVRIGASIGASNGVPTAAMRNRGAAVAALVHALEATGFRVEANVSNVIGQWHTSRICAARVRIKDATQPLNFATLAFALSHPSMLRRVGFAVVETMPRTIARDFLYTGNHIHYGLPATDEEFVANSDIYVGTLLDAPNVRIWTDPDSVHTWVVEQLHRQGITIKGE